MIDIGNNIQPQNLSNNRGTWCTSSTSINSNELNKVTRKFINSAIYVEKPLNCNISAESISISQKTSFDNVFEAKTKKCTCSVNRKTCPCHLNNVPDELEIKGNEKIVNPVTKNHKLREKTAKISLHSSSNNSRESVKEKNAVKKEVSRKSETNKVEKRSNEKEVQLEEERENFKRWLANKKRQETEMKKKKEKELEEIQLRKLEKEKKQLENQLNFQYWLKKKEEEDLEKKIQKQTRVFDKLKQREEQLKANERAFSEWLKKAKNRPKPMNGGIQTMWSSTSVTYVNENSQGDL